MNIKQIASLLRETVASWSDDYAPSMGAALAYYTLFSIAPLLLIVISVAGLVFGEEAARGEILIQLQDLMGVEGALAVQALLKSVSMPTKGVVATAVGVTVLLIGATTVFGELQNALDRIWRVPAGAGGSGLWKLLRARLLSFGMILGIGFLLVVSLVASAGLAALGQVVGTGLRRLDGAGRSDRRGPRLRPVHGQLRVALQVRAPGAHRSGATSGSARPSPRCSSPSASSRSACTSGGRVSRRVSALRRRWSC